MQCIEEDWKWAVISSALCKWKWLYEKLFHSTWQTGDRKKSDRVWMVHICLTTVVFELAHEPCLCLIWDTTDDALCFLIVCCRDKLDGDFKRDRWEGRQTTVTVKDSLSHWCCEGQSQLLVLWRTFFITGAVKDHLYCWCCEGPSPSLVLQRTVFLTGVVEDSLCHWCYKG